MSTLEFKWEDKGFQLMPEGDYEARVTKCMLDTSKETPKIGWGFQVTKGEYEGATIFENQSITPKSYMFVKAKIGAFGHSKFQPTDLPKILEGIYGKDVMIRVTHNVSKTDPEKTFQNVEILKTLDFSEIPF